MLTMLKKNQPLSLAILKKTPCFHRILIGLNLSPNQISPAEYPSHQNVETDSEQYEEGRRPHLEDIPELEEEAWEDRQFADADFIDYHNTTQESDRI